MNDWEQDTSLDVSGTSNTEVQNKESQLILEELDRIIDDFSEWKNRLEKVSNSAKNDRTQEEATGEEEKTSTPKDFIDKVNIRLVNLKNIKSDIKEAILNLEKVF